MSEWHTVRLGDVCATNSSSYSKNDNWKFVNYLDTGNITQNHIDSIQMIDLSGEKLPSRAKRKVQHNDILFSTVRPNQLHYGIIKEQPTNFLVSTGFAVISVMPEKVDADYLYFYLSQNSVIEGLHAIAEQSTSAYPSIKPSDIEKMMIQLPSLEVQKKVAAVLLSIEQKIVLNNAINENLEQQAQAIFKYWFVDFEPFGNNMPDNWTMGIINDLAEEIICGKTPSTKIKEYYGSDIPFITIPDMHGNTYAVTTERYLSQYGANSQPKKSLPKNSTCISCIGTAGLVTLVATESQTNQQINSIIPKHDYSPYYIYLLMQTMSKVINKLGQSGSTIVNLNKAQFGKMQAIIPSITVMKSFDEVVSPIFEMILERQMENTRLVSLRDILLLKLMSGEIDVSNIKL